MILSDLEFIQWCLRYGHFKWTIKFSLLLFHYNFKMIWCRNHDELTKIKDFQIILRLNDGFNKLLYFLTNDFRWVIIKFVNPWFFLHSEIPRKWTLFRIKLKQISNSRFRRDFWNTIWYYNQTLQLQHCHHVCSKPWNFFEILQKFQIFCRLNAPGYFNIIHELENHNYSLKYFQV